MSFWETARRQARPWGFAAVLLLVLVLFRRIALPFALAIMLAYVLHPLVARLSRVRARGRAVPRWAAVLVVYLGILASLGLFFGAFLPRLSGDVARLFREAPAFFAKVKSDYVPRASGWLEQNFPSDDRDEAAADGPRPERKLQVTETAPGRWDVSLEGLDVEVAPIGQGRFAVGPRREPTLEGRLADLMANLARSTESETMAMLKLGQRFAAGLLKGLATIVLILMVSAFLLVDAERVMAFVRGLVPAEKRSGYDAVLREVDRGLAGVIRGQLAICLVNGALTYLGLVILHVKYPLLLGLLAAAMSLIPVFGSILSSVPIVAVALVGAGTFDLRRGLAVLAWIVGIHLLEANFLNPKILGSAARIHPVVVVFALLVGEETGGLTGALVAVPVASVLQTLFLYFRRRAEEREDSAAVAE